MRPATHDAIIRTAVQSADRGFIDRLIAKRCGWRQQAAATLRARRAASDAIAQAVRAFRGSSRYLLTGVVHRVRSRASKSF